MKAKDLQPGQEFKLDKGQRKWRVVYKTHHFDETMFHEPARNKVLIILPNCNQILLDPEREVIINFKGPLMAL